MIPYSRLIPAIRKVWLWSEHRREAIKASKCDGGYECNHCGIVIKTQKELKVDHITQVKAFGEIDWNSYITNMFTGELQILCKECHDKKTAYERATSAAYNEGVKLEKLLIFFKGLYYKETFVNEEWDSYAISDQQYDMLENSLRRISEKYNFSFPVLSCVGFPYRENDYAMKIKVMLENEVGKDTPWDDELESLYNKFISKKKKVKKLKY